MRKPFAIFLLLFAFLSVLPTALASCGDDYCAPGENRCSCPEDCGSCSGSAGTCLEYKCNLAGNCTTQKVFNCCGNALCEIGETFTSCASDCAPRAISITPVNWDSVTKRLRGDEVIITVEVEGDGAPLRDASVFATGFFGQIQLYDDGQHSDGSANNGVYGNSFTIPSGTEARKHTISVSASGLGLSETESVTVNVDPSLDFDITLEDQVTYVLGDEIIFTGTLTKKGLPLAEEVFVNLGSHSQTLTPSPETGFFSFSYRTSLIDNPGAWILQLTASDDQGNEGLLKQTVNVLQSEQEDYYEVKMVTPTETVFARGETIKILVDVMDNGEPVDEAKVFVLLPTKERVNLSYLEPGRYGLNFKIPFDFPLKNQSFRIEAQKLDEFVLNQGFANFDLVINTEEILVDLISPAVFGARRGEVVFFDVRFRYGIQPVDLSHQLRLAQVTRLVSRGPALQKLAESINGHMIELLKVGKAMTVFHAGFLILDCAWPSTALPFGPLPGWGSRRGSRWAWRRRPSSVSWGWSPPWAGPSHPMRPRWARLRWRSSAPPSGRRGSGGTRTWWAAPST